MTLDDALVQALRGNWRTAPVSEAERMMIEYALQLTGDGTRISAAYHERLRRAGYDDRGMPQITLIASWFNYISPVADALGVGRA